MKGKFAYLATALLLSFGAFGLSSCGKQDSGNNGSQQTQHTVTLSESVLKLDMGETADLVLTVDGSADISDLHPSWRSSNKQIVTVSKGTITAVADGEADITVIVRDNSLRTLGEAACHIIVGGSKIHFTQSSVTLYVTGNENTVQLLIEEDVSDINWETSDSTIASVDNGLVTALSAGEVTITATAGELSGKCNITVFDEKLSLPSLTFVKPSQQVTLALEGTIDSSAIWTNSNPEVATLENGIVTGVADGFTEITLNYKGQIVSTVVAVSSAEKTEKVNLTKGKKADAASNPGKWYYLLESSQVTTSAVPSIENNVIDYDILTIGTSGANYAYLRYQPDAVGANLYNVTYYIYSSNASTIAFDGNDTELQPGVNVITREFESKAPSAQAPAQLKFRSIGHYYIMPVFTFVRELSVLKVSETNKILYLSGGDSSFTLNATLDNNQVDVEWLSTNEAVATVENGVVTAVGAGDTQIRATYNGLTATCDVKVESEYIDGKYYLPSNGQKGNVCADPGKWFYFVEGGSVAADPYAINDTISINIASVGSKFIYLRYQLPEEGNYTASIELSVESFEENQLFISGGSGAQQTLVMAKATETLTYDFDYKSDTPFQLKFQSAGNYTIKVEFAKNS